MKPVAGRDEGVAAIDFSGKLDDTQPMKFAFE